MATHAHSLVLALLVISSRVGAASIQCAACAEWNRDQAPFQIFGNTYYVGTHGLSAVLITAPTGHILIDGALPQSAPLIAEHVRRLGFKITDVKVILSSHAHFDHAGGIAELQRLSGAKVIASVASAEVLRTGRLTRSDPQFESRIDYPGVSGVTKLAPNETTVVLGELRLIALATPGHTPGGTSWTWQACEGERCLHIVYADSLNAVSDASFKYRGDARYPRARTDLMASIAALSGVPCDILVSTHPDASGLQAMFDVRGGIDRARLINAGACRAYAAAAGTKLEARLHSER